MIIDSQIINLYRRSSYPAGASWVGAVDMSGNVWEWTSSEFFGYPYDPTDGREITDITSAIFPVLRGGSFGNDSLSVRAAFRNGSDADVAFINVGFRCARS